MKILIVGGGGREHAILKSLYKSHPEAEYFVLPGNGGIAKLAEIAPIGAKDLDRIVSYATEKKIDFAVVAQDDPLALGLVDRLAEVNIPAFGPNKAAARIEGSKAFAKDLMRKYQIPTADYQVFDDASAAKAYLQEQTAFPVVVKADGLALGKGVLICETKEAALDAVDEMMISKQFGDSGNQIVIEEFLEGPEVTVLSFTDGKTLIPMVSSMDHKRAHDGDVGLNTGGMGVIAPNPFYTEEVAKICEETIFLPTLRAMEAEGCPFKGCLYFGLMLTKNGPKVIEYNCRFGDPETQTVLPLLEGDLLAIMQATVDGSLHKQQVSFKNLSACCVVLASGGYPESYEKGKKIDFTDFCETEDLHLFHAGTKQEGEDLVTSGGRVLAVTALDETLPLAAKKAYDAVKKIHFEGAFCRSDIGKKAMDVLQSRANNEHKE